MGRTRHTKRQSALLKQRFLEQFRQCGNVRDAARIVGIARSLPYCWLKTDQAFAEMYREAEEEAVDNLDGEAQRRAMGEVLKPVHYKGKVVGHVPSYSDGLLMFLLKARRPKVYRDQCQHPVAAAGEMDTDPRPVFPLEALRALLDDDESER